MSLKKKVVMLGAYGVGKTSLVRRFVSNKFSDEYLSTLGVRIEKREIALGDQALELLLWDVAGDDEFFRLRSSYLLGASGPAVGCRWDSGLDRGEVGRAPCSG